MAGRQKALPYRFKNYAPVTSARAESIWRMPSVAAAWEAGRRCLVPVNRFYVSQRGEKASARYNTWTVAGDDRATTALAALWQPRNASDPNDFDSCALITVEVDVSKTPFRERMPLILARESWAPWLGETKATDEALMALMGPLRSDRFDARSVDAEESGAQHRRHRRADDSRGKSPRPGRAFLR